MQIIFCKWILEYGLDLHGKRYEKRFMEIFTLMKYIVVILFLFFLYNDNLCFVILELYWPCFQKRNKTCNVLLDSFENLFGSCVQFNIRIHFEVEWSTLLLFLDFNCV